MPSSRSDWDAFSSSSLSSSSWIASEGMASGDDLDFLWSGVEVSVSVSEANEGSDGSGTVGVEPEWEDEELLEASFDFEGRLEIGVGILDDEGNEVDRAAEGGSFDSNFDSAEELLQGRAGEEADCVDKRVLPVSFGDILEERCDLEEGLEFVQEFGGSGGLEQDHVTEVVDFEETLGVYGNSVAHSSDVVDNSNMDGYIRLVCDLEEGLEFVQEFGGSGGSEQDHVTEVVDFEETLGVYGNSVAHSSDVVDNSNMDGYIRLVDSFGISGDGMEEGHTSEESSDFDDDTLSRGDINLEHNNRSSNGESWGFVDSLRGGSHDNVIQGDYVVFGDLDSEGSVQQIFDQIMRNDIRRRRASAAAKDVVERLPMMEVKEGMFKGSDSDGACAVCKNNVQVGERVRRLPCLHYFHEECIMPWLEIRNTCPLCRHELPTEDAGSEGIKRRRVDPGSWEGGPSPNQLL